ncbi:MAG: MBL fold metallo-hydrolase [Urechidicola sp.]|nr:MBL fold metallo-hydrolase [Urechidicola sp.]
MKSEKWILTKGYVLISFLILSSCQTPNSQENLQRNNPYIFVLGVAQDAGYPQINCEKECCQRVYKTPENKRFISSIAIIDPVSKEEWIFDATPSLTDQIKLLNNQTQRQGDLPEGIFLTHAHIGHYTGLMYLGHEAMGASNVPVYAMPRMNEYLKINGPWSQLVEYKNIELKGLQKDSTTVLNERISAIPIQVPHRDEYSETVGFLIDVNSKQVLFIPDIDKWSKWERSIVEYIQQVDIAFVDATFFKNGEINRDMSQVLHPFVEESMGLFQNLSDIDKAKVHFIHFNHTNPLLIKGSDAQKTVLEKGFRFAEQGMIIEL